MRRMAREGMKRGNYRVWRIVIIARMSLTARRVRVKKLLSFDVEASFSNGTALCSSCLGIGLEQRHVSTQIGLQQRHCVSTQLGTGVYPLTPKWKIPVVSGPQYKVRIPSCASTNCQLGIFSNSNVGFCIGRRSIGMTVPFPVGSENTLRIWEGSS